MPWTPDPCARCGELILDDEERVVLHRTGGRRMFHEFPFEGFVFDSTCFAVVLEGVLREVGVGRAVEIETPPC